MKIEKGLYMCNSTYSYILILIVHILYYIGIYNILRILYALVLYK